MKKNRIQLDRTLNADLHCHSVYSDGLLTPEALAQRAKMNGVGLWALTDHDDISGVAAAAAAAQQLDLPFLNGVEISTCFGIHSIHVIGLGVDINHSGLQQGLSEIRSGRGERARKIANALENMGVEDALAGAMYYAGNTDLLSRTHFARFLVSRNICRDKADAFNKYLHKGKPAYVEHGWVSLPTCLNWIRAAGGVAVLAHPARYTTLSKNQRRRLFMEFTSLGGCGVEVVTGSHSKEDAVLYAQMAQHYGLMASRGSDFHSPEESRIDLGMLPLLDVHDHPIWETLADRIIQ